MKAAAFDYTRAQDLEQALELLAQHGSEAKLIAGGQSLVPMMAMRLARPTQLVDIYRLDALRQINVQQQTVMIGAAVRQKEVQDKAELLRQLPLLANALPWVGHQQTRNRGTVGGSLAHADPSAELPLAFLVLGGAVHVRKHGQVTRRIAAEDFFLGPMITSLAEDECLVHSEWPIRNSMRSASAFEETAIRHGDFAMAAAGCQISLDSQGCVSELSLGVGGVGPVPRVFPELSSEWLGQVPSAQNIEALAHQVSAELDPHSDVHVNASFRRHLARVLLQRVLTQAAQGASQASQKP